MCLCVCGEGVSNVVPTTLLGIFRDLPQPVNVDITTVMLRNFFEIWPGHYMTRFHVCISWLFLCVTVCGWCVSVCLCVTECVCLSVYVSVCFIMCEDMLVSFCLWCECVYVLCVLGPSLNAGCVWVCVFLLFPFLCLLLLFVVVYVSLYLCLCVGVSPCHNCTYTKNMRLCIGPKCCLVCSSIFLARQSCSL